MKTFQLLFSGLFLVLLSVTLTSEVYAQNNQLPAELTESSSLAEILDWLDKTNVSSARIGVVAEDSGLENPIFHSPFQSAFFSQGFKIAKVEKECQLTLRNEQSIFTGGFVGYRINSGYEDFARFITDAVNNRSVYKVEIFINLKRINQKKGKSPFFVAENLEKAKLFGTWRIQFKENGINAIRADIFVADKQIKAHYIDADKLMFTFENQEMAETFNMAFRRAIKLCKAK